MSMHTHMLKRHSYYVSCWMSSWRSQVYSMLSKSLLIMLLIICIGKLLMQRCWTLYWTPYATYFETNEIVLMEQGVLHPVTKKKWSSISLHFYVGGGENVSFIMGCFCVQLLTRWVSHSIDVCVMELMR